MSWLTYILALLDSCWCDLCANDPEPPRWWLWETACFRAEMQTRAREER